MNKRTRRQTVGRTTRSSVGAAVAESKANSRRKSAGDIPNARKPRGSTTRQPKEGVRVTMNESEDGRVPKKARERGGAGGKADTAPAAAAAPAPAPAPAPVTVAAPAASGGGGRIQGKSKRARSVISSDSEELSGSEGEREGEGGGDWKGKGKGKKKAVKKTRTSSIRSSISSGGRKARGSRGKGGGEGEEENMEVSDDESAAAAGAADRRGNGGGAAEGFGDYFPLPTRVVNGPRRSLPSSSISRSTSPSSRHPTLSSATRSSPSYPSSARSGKSSGKSSGSNNRMTKSPYRVDTGIFVPDDQVPYLGVGWRRSSFQSGGGGALPASCHGREEGEGGGGMTGRRSDLAAIPARGIRGERGRGGEGGREWRDDESSGEGDSESEGEGGGRVMDKSKAKVVEEKAKTGGRDGGGSQTVAEAGAGVSAAARAERDEGGLGVKLTEKELKAAREAVLARKKDEDREMLLREYPELDEEDVALIINRCARERRTTMYLRDSLAPFVKKRAWPLVSSCLLLAFIFFSLYFLNPWSSSSFHASSSSSSSMELRKGGREEGQDGYAQKKAVAEILARKIWEERQQTPVVVVKPEGGGEEPMEKSRGDMEKELEEKRRKASEAARAFELKHALYPRSKELQEQEERDAARQKKQMEEEERAVFEMATKAKAELVEMRMKQVASRKEREDYIAATGTTLVMREEEGGREGRRTGKLPASATPIMATAEERETKGGLEGTPASAAFPGHIATPSINEAGGTQGGLEGVSASMTPIMASSEAASSSSSSSDSTVYADITSIASREQLHARKVQIMDKIQEMEKVAEGIGMVLREVREKEVETAGSTKDWKEVREIVLAEVRERVRLFIEEQIDMWARKGKEKEEEIWESTRGKAFKELMETKEEVEQELEQVRQITMELDAVKATFEEQQQQQQQQQRLESDVSEEPSKQQQQQHHHLRSRTAELTDNVVEGMQQREEGEDQEHASLSFLPKSKGDAKRGKNSEGKHRAAREQQEAEAIFALLTEESALVTVELQRELQAWEEAIQEMQDLRKELEKMMEDAKIYMRVDPFLLERHTEADGDRILVPHQSSQTEVVAKARAEERALLDRAMALTKGAEVLDKLTRECTKSKEDISAALTALEESMRLEKEQRDVGSVQHVRVSKPGEDANEQDEEEEVGTTKEEVVEAFRQRVRNEIRDLEIRAWNTRDIQDSQVEERPEVSDGLSATERGMFKKELEEREELQSLLRIINYALDESLRENLDIWSKSSEVGRMLDPIGHDKKTMEMEMALRWRHHHELTRLVEHLGMVDVNMGQLRAGAWYVGVHGAIEAQHGFDYARWFHGADVVLDPLHTTPPYKQIVSPGMLVDDVMKESVPPSLPLHWPKSQTRGKKVGECYCMALAPGLSPSSYTIKFQRPVDVSVLSTLSLTHFYRPWYVLRWLDYAWQPKRDEYHYDTVGSVAPREVVLWGVPSMKAARKDMKRGRKGEEAGLVWLGNFTFLLTEPFYRTQFWPLAKPEGGRQEEKIEGVRLEIISNHGNEEYTCLYRVGVYGERVEEFENDEPWMGWLHAIQVKLGEAMALVADTLEDVIDDYDMTKEGNVQGEGEREEGGG